MDPITVLALLCAFVLVTLTVADINDARTDDDAWFDNEPLPPIRSDRDPRDAA